MPKAKAKPKPLEPTGVAALDDIGALSVTELTISHYVRAASAYVRESQKLSVGKKKSAQIRLSIALGKALAHDLSVRLPRQKNVVVGERKVSGALRSVNADVSELHETDGLRLAVELKPVNLAVGRAIWNRFGDIRTFAVNLHLKFPFAVVGGVLAIPTYEAIGTTEEVVREISSEDIDEAGLMAEAEVLASTTDNRRSTTHLIERAIARLMRAGGRKTEGDAPHLLEAIAVVVYDPDSGELSESLPPRGSGLRWTEFIENLAVAYESRFEE